jgi:phosphomannomutase/phosphoglucomutase
MSQLPAEIFKAYDIRGIVDKSLTAEVVRQIGHALGSLAVEQARRPSPSAATAACPARNWPAP